MATITLDRLLTSNGVSKEALKCRVREEHRLEIARVIGHEWEILAVFIGIPSSDIDDIKMGNLGSLERSVTLLRRWSQLCGSEATYLRLAQGLLRIGRRDLTELVIHQLKSGYFGPGGHQEFCKYVKLVNI